jgi:cytochrome c-type biogenesis protein CcmH
MVFARKIITMPETVTTRRFSTSTVALIGAALLAVLAIGIAISRSGAQVEETPQGNVAAGSQPGNVEEMIAGLRERLRQDPDNHEGFFLLGMAYRDSGRIAEAEQAFRRAMELAPGNADYAAYLGEALLLIGRDEPPPEAERLFRRVLELEPGNAQARYYLATMRDLRGDHRGAVDELIDLLGDAPPGASWEPQVREAVTAIARENRIDIAGRLPAAPQTSVATAAIPGPTREQMESAKGIPPGAQDAMVKGMVDRLANRLRQNPRDADGWIRLMRSRMVLNDPAAAREALRSGLAAFQGDAATQQNLRTAAAELGVPAA